MKPVSALHHAYGQLGEDMARLPWTGDSQNEVDFSIAWLELEPGCRVLDAGCGYGRHLIEFAKRGFKVTGVEISDTLATIASRSVEDLGLDAEVLSQDARNRVGSAFDAVVCFAEGPIGYLPTDRENLQLFDTLASSLRSGGQLFLELTNSEAITRACPTRFWSERNGVIQLSEWQYAPRTGYTLRRETIVLESGKRYCWESKVRAFPLPELANILASFGIKIEDAVYEMRIDAQFTGREWDMILKGRKD